MLLNGPGEGKGRCFDIRCSDHPTKKWDDVALEGGEGGIGVAGEGDDSFPEGEGLAGALGDTVKDGFSAK